MQRWLKRATLVAVVAGLSHSMTAEAASATQVEPELLAGMRARSIGPAGMSGRVAAIAVVTADPNVIYVGAATGGLWKSTDGGLRWTSLFDEEPASFPVASIGAIGIFQERPDVVWIGTGEGNPRNSAAGGNGVYKSLDGGRTWRHLGLERTEKIHRILLHPTDPEVAYVAALGTSWGENEQRGVFKTTDGGESWEHVLYVDERTGCADLELDPTNPDKLIAAMWDHRRWPHFFRSGGPGSGLHVTVDGGATWERRTAGDGLPKGELGRIGIAIAPSDPEVVYALVEAEENALLRSDDGGRTWASRSSGSDVARRPFYFADIRVDPADPDRIYDLASIVTVSDDGGRTFETLVPWSLVHPDHHAMWIHPEDPRFIIDGNDGGVAISRDRGETWRFVRNLPLAQFYHVAVDDDVPYHVYGGMQDNGSWRGPSAVWENGGIRNHHWEEVGFGDGFATVPIPGESHTGYAMSQGGYLMRWDVRTGERKTIRPDAPEGVELRFNWNAGLAVDARAPDVVYYGSQFLHRSDDRGETWRIISPDLTTNNPAWQKQDESGGLTPDVTDAENYTSILTIAPSPLREGVLWVGSDDGRIHVTRDGGESWASVEGNVPDVPANTWIPHIEASKFDPAAAFAVFDDHRRASWATYLFETHDYGASWRRVATEGVEGYALTVEQDFLRKELLFLGTELGLFVTTDGGGEWWKWKHGVPTVAVRSLVVHPREHDLVIGTHGRAAYVLDDIRPLRRIADVRGPLALFAIPDAQQYRIKQTGESRFPGTEEFRGENRPYGARITFLVEDDSLPHPEAERERERKAALPATAAGEGEDEARVKIRILEGDAVIRTLTPKATQGVNRVAWDLRRKAFERPRGDDEEEDEDEERAGPEVLPGTYGVRVKLGERTATGSVRVLADPRFDLAPEERAANWSAIQRAGALQERVAEAVRRIRTTRADVDVVLARVAALEEARDEDGEGPHGALKEAAETLKKALSDVEKTLWTPPDTKGIPADRTVLAKVDRARWGTGSSWSAPTPAHLALLDRADRAWREALPEVNRVLGPELDTFRAAVQAAGIVLLEAFVPFE